MVCQIVGITLEKTVDGKLPTFGARCFGPSIQKDNESLRRRQMPCSATDSA
jgi:hypothetical protein